MILRQSPHSLGQSAPSTSTAALECRGAAAYRPASILLKSSNFQMQRTSLLRALSLKPFTRWNPQSTPRPSMLLLGVARANDSVRVRIHRDGAVNRHFPLAALASKDLKGRGGESECTDRTQKPTSGLLANHRPRPPTEGERVLPLCKQSDIF